MSQPHTLVHQFAGWAAKKPTSGAIFGRTASGEWTERSWRQYFDACRRVGKGLMALGVQHGECVAIVGDNRPEWVIAQFGMMAVGAVPAPIYTTNTIPQVAYIVDHCQAKVAICDGKAQLDKYLAGINDGSITNVKHLVVFDKVDATDERVMTLESLMALGDKEVADADFDARFDALKTDEPALLIYTSGTTGVPKAVQLSHAGMLMVGDGLMAGFPELREEGAYRVISYLPLCHVAEQVFTNILHLNSGGTCYFCADLKQIKDHLTSVRPTVFLGVPRVWEKFESALRAKLSEATGLKAKLAGWARNTELACFQRQVQNGVPYMPFKRKLANKLVISKIKNALGLDQLLVAGTGAAPISRRTLEFFASIGITIYEGYGMSETSGVASVTDRHKPRFGTVGRALPGVDVRIAEDGEILLKGVNMTPGYLHMPDKTAELIDDEGWLHTGDLGAIDDEQNIKITGRKKDLLITAGGKNVAPAELEAYIKRVVGVGQAVVVGDSQPYLCALIALDAEGLSDLASTVGVPNGSLEEMAKNEKVKAYIMDQIEIECNAKVARYQTIKKIEMLPHAFTVETGELTPTMKIKRNVVSEKYKAAIDGLYS